MKIGNWVRVIAVASVVGAGAAPPAWSGGNSVTLQNYDGATNQSDNATIQSDNAVIRSDNATIRSWAQDTAAQNGGVIREDAYLDEMGRRWDANPDRTGMRGVYLDDLRARWEAADRSGQGLTPAEVSEMTPRD